MINPNRQSRQNQSNIDDTSREVVGGNIFFGFTNPSRYGLIASNKFFTSFDYSRKKKRRKKKR